MAAINSGDVIRLWKPTAELPGARPYGITTSPDGVTLYVNGIGAGGWLAAINTGSGETTTIGTGLGQMRQGMFTDDAGRLYYATGGDDIATVYRWDGSSATALFSDNGIYTMARYGDRIYYTRNNVISPGVGGDRRKLVSRSLDGSVIYYNNVALQGEQFGQFRGIAVGETRIALGKTNTGHFLRLDRLTGAHIAESSASGYQGGHAVSDTEMYLLSTGGGVARLNALTGARTTLNLAGDPTYLDDFVSDRGYGSIHISPLGNTFITQGGWNGSPGSIGDRDSTQSPLGDIGAGATDVGIWRIGGTGWCVGFVGIG